MFNEYISNSWLTQRPIIIMNVDNKINRLPYVFRYNKFIQWSQNSGNDSPHWTEGKCPINIGKMYNKNFAFYSESNYSLFMESGFMKILF